MKYHFAIFIGPPSAGTTQSALESIIKKMGFTDIFNDGTIEFPCFRNMFTGYFEYETIEPSIFSVENGARELISIISEKYKEELKLNNIGSNHFFIVDITHAQYKLDSFSDGFY